MKIIHVVPAITEEASGPSYSVTRLCETLAAQGEDITLAALDMAPMQSPPAFLKTFQFGWGPRRLGCSPTMLRWLEEVTRAGAIDVLHNHSLWMMPNIYPGWVAKQNKVPLVIAPRGTLSVWAMRSGSVVKWAFWPLMQRRILQIASCFHATAEAEYQDIRRMGFRQPVAIIPNGIDIPAYLQKPQKTPRTLLFLSRIHPVKGLDILLPAWKAVQGRFPDWHLQIVGPDNNGYLAQMQRLALDLRLERVEFSGALYGENKWQAYRQAELFVLPTYSENFGMAVAEALAAGTPAIVSKGAPWENLEIHQAGWWIDIGLDPLVTCLESALSKTSAELAGMGVRGYNLMEREYSWPQISWKMVETYKWLLSQNTPPPSWIQID